VTTGGRVRLALFSALTALLLAMAAACATPRRPPATAIATPPGSGAVASSSAALVKVCDGPPHQSRGCSELAHQAAWARITTFTHSGDACLTYDGKLIWCVRVNEIGPLASAGAQPILARPFGGQDVMAVEKPVARLTVAATYSTDGGLVVHVTNGDTFDWNNCDVVLNGEYTAGFNGFPIWFSGISAGTTLDVLSFVDDGGTAYSRDVDGVPRTIIVHCVSTAHGRADGSAFITAGQ